jgi:hypothetical protein
MTSIIAHPCFWLVAVVLSVYYGVRGTIIAVKKKYEGWSLWQKVFAQYIYAFIFNFLGGLVGFVGISLACQVYEQAGSPHQFESGTAILLGFLGLVGIAGITGTLPEMLYLGRLFGPK